MNQTETHLPADVLESEGVEATVRKEFLRTPRSCVPLTSETAPSVRVVNYENYKQATEIAEEFKTPENAGGQKNDAWK